MSDLHYQPFDSAGNKYGELKPVVLRILVNEKVKMSPGKLAAQAVHAALMAYGIQHGAVVVLQGSPNELMNLKHQVRDAGRTEVEPGTLTAATDGL